MTEKTSSSQRLGYDSLLLGRKMLCAPEAERQSDSCP